MIDLWRKLNGDREEYTFLSVVHGTHTKTDHVPGRKDLTIQCWKAEIVKVSFSDHNTIKLLGNQRPWKHKPQNNWKLNNLILKNEWVKQQITETHNNFIKENNSNETINQDLRDVVKTDVRGNFISLNVYMNKIEKEENNKLNK